MVMANVMKDGNSCGDEYQNVFDWQNWSFVSFAGYNQADSNINFYDEQQYLLFLGLNYRF